MKTLKYMLFGLFLVCSMPSQAALITIIPSNTQVFVGQTISFQIQLSELAPGEVLALFDFTFLIDETFFSLQSVLFGQALGGPGDSEQYIDGLAFFESSYLTDVDLLVKQVGSFTLLTLNFKTMMPGMDQLVLLSINPFGLLNYDFLEIDAQIRSTSVSILTRPTSVPTPATLSMMLLALLLLYLTRRRTRQAPATNWQY